MTDGKVRNRQLVYKTNTTTMVKLLTLSILITDGKSYGNELIEKIESIMKYSWRPSPGMMYPLLEQMENEGLVESWWDKPYKKSKKNYKISSLGISTYQREKIERIKMINDNINVLSNVLKALE